MLSCIAGNVPDSLFDQEDTCSGTNFGLKRFYLVDFFFLVQKCSRLNYGVLVREPCQDISSK